ncbi:hypothetical protein F8A86_01080 [Betaproteobacteria bacterium SCN1]|jgi:type I restriction enzyme S subunit|nr:hypothetical protein F8A86_01080 [Betaproteobacteria bacterium SCN1]
MTKGEFLPLEEVCTVEYGTRVVQKRDGGSIYPVYGGGGATFRMDTSNREDRLVVSRFGMSDECTRFVTGKFFLNDSGLTVSPRNGKLLPRFLDFQILSLNDEIFALGKGAAQKNLDVPAFRSLPIFVPSNTREQQRIVAILDQAFDGITTAKANAEKNLQNARALFESHLQSVFTRHGQGWVEKSLAELGTITSSKRIFKSEYVKSGVPFYRTKEIKELANDREITTELFISEDRYKEIETCFGVPKEGDILLTAIGTIGEIWVVEGDSDFYFKDGNVLWLKEFNSVNPHFLKYVLLSFVESLNKMSHGAAYSALPIQRLNAHRVFLPSQAEQGQIVSALDALREETQRLESLYQRKLAALDDLKKSLLHQAFSGAL